MALLKRGENDCPCKKEIEVENQIEMNTPDAPMASAAEKRTLAATGFVACLLMFSLANMRPLASLFLALLVGGGLGFGAAELLPTLNARARKWLTPSCLLVTIVIAVFLMYRIWFSLS
jgi:uncharacterized membrane protein YcjF (UPF0283 family)